jgi:hypothetical protein
LTRLAGVRAVKVEAPGLPEVKIRARRGYYQYAIAPTARSSPKI